MTSYPGVAVPPASTSIRRVAAWCVVVLWSCAAAAGPLDHRYDEAAAKAGVLDRAVAGADRASANQLLYDVVHYDLELVLHPTTRVLNGTVTTTARVLSGPLDRLELNLKAARTVDGVRSGGTPVAFLRNVDVLTAVLDRPYQTGELVQVAVDYHGDPTGQAFGWSVVDQEPMIWTLSEPYGAREWWPCKDVNTDKADSLDLRVTVPDGLVVASNGVLVSETLDGGERTFHWRCLHPIVPYLVSLAVHPYARFSHWYTPGAGGDPMEVSYFVYPSHYEAVQSTYGLVVPMLERFAAGFGEYPFLDEKYGHAEFVWGGGMEHQTLSSLGGWSEDLISHELAHQWWGDDVTCADFRHIWLNEGFATWAEAYWLEAAYGVQAYRDKMQEAAYRGWGTIIVENPLDAWAIFNVDLSYNKASWVPHMLRGMMGDAAFFAGLRDYRALYGGGSATTEQFRDVMELHAGRDLDDFFQQWIYGEYYPVYHYDWLTTSHAGGDVLHLVIAQSQLDTGLFSMPVEVAVTTAAGESRRVLEVTRALESWQLPVDGPVLDVTLDPDGWILCDVAHEALATTGVGTPAAPGGVALSARPNPFNPCTEIACRLDAEAPAELALFDALGARLCTLHAGPPSAGEHRFIWRGCDDAGRAQASGTYFVRLSLPGGTTVRPLTLVR